MDPHAYNELVLWAEFNLPADCLLAARAPAASALRTPPAVAEPQGLCALLQGHPGVAASAPA